MTRGAAYAATPVRRPRTWGVWIFVLALACFWGLLAASGQKWFRPIDGPEAGLRVRAADLVGVTRIRLEAPMEERERHRFRPTTTVRYFSADDVHIRTRRSAERSHGPRSGAVQWLAAWREGDTLVLRDGGAPPEEAGRHWVAEVFLPLQFQHLHVEDATVDVDDPLPRLQVQGHRLHVRGKVDSLDVRLLVPCEGPVRHRNHRVQVDAAQMRQLVVEAAAGEVSLGDTEGLRELTLAVGDSVSLSLDRAGALALAPGRRPVNDTPPCDSAQATQPAPSAQRLDLVKVD